MLVIPGDCRRCGHLTATYWQPRPGEDLKVPCCPECLRVLFDDQAARDAFALGVTMELAELVERFEADDGAVN